MQRAALRGTARRWAPRSVALGTLRMLSSRSRRSLLLATFWTLHGIPRPVGGHSAWWRAVRAPPALCSCSGSTKMRPASVVAAIRGSVWRVPRPKGFGADAIPRRSEPSGLRLTLWKSVIVPEAEGRAGGCLSLMARGPLRHLATGKAGVRETGILVAHTLNCRARGATVAQDGLRGSPRARRPQTGQAEDEKAMLRRVTS